MLKLSVLMKRMKQLHKLRMISLIRWKWKQLSRTRRRMMKLKKLGWHMRRKSKSELKLRIC